jgi:hypothetical protein
MVTIEAAIKLLRVTLSIARQVRDTAELHDGVAAPALAISIHFG